MRTGISFTVSPSDHARLRALIRDRNSPQKQVWRAAIILLSAASRLAADVNVQNRVNELTAATVKALQRKPSYEPLKMFERLSELVDKAEEQGDIKNALAGQMFIIECFGYRESPTLTHEDIRGVHGQKDDGAPHEREEPIRFPKSIAELKRRTGLN